MPIPTATAPGSIALIHNGIIENYISLKESLTAAGHVFSSDTDTEVLAHLIESHLQRRGRWNRPSGRRCRK